jgi:hypothetical protein
VSDQLSQPYKTTGKQTCKPAVNVLYFLGEQALITFYPLPEKSYEISTHKTQRRTKKDVALRPLKSDIGTRR